MLSRYFIPLMISILCLYGCRGEPATVTIPKSELPVWQFVNLLTLDQYDSLDLPAYSSQDIPQLLDYRDDTTRISVFPRNPISSFYLSEVRLGIFMLWNVESIRLIHIESEDLNRRFPSKNPVLAFRDSSSVVLADELSHELEAAEAYYSWWYNAGELPLWQLMEIDPLAETPYIWF